MGWDEYYDWDDVFAQLSEIEAAAIEVPVVSTTPPVRYKLYSQQRIKELLAEAWDEGYTCADNGGDESENPHK